jgi:uncharacterized membrane protein
MSRRTGGWLLALLALGLAVPLVPLAGTSAAWGMLPFLLAALFALYLAFRRSYDDGRLSEELRLWPDLITVERREPRGRVRRWHANPFWVRLRLQEDAKVEKYLTLEGGGREIELGAFLSPAEREDLYRQLGAALDRLRTGGGAP